MIDSKSCAAHLGYVKSDNRKTLRPLYDKQPAHVRKLRESAATKQRLADRAAFKQRNPDLFT